ncbi:MAG: DUF4912 domain-containing protein [Deltaproteobacteria bacterium]|nr:DUF4912 domain-containing protein [Deltaproteobacteria bacterium]
MTETNNKPSQDGNPSTSPRRSIVPAAASLTAMMRDPLCIFCCWEILPDTTTAAPAATVLRVHDITDRRPADSPSHSFVDLFLISCSGSRYIHRKHPAKRFFIELGLKKGSTFYPLTNTGPLQTPPAQPSGTSDPQWPISEDTFLKLCALSNNMDADSSLTLQSTLSSTGIPTASSNPPMR